jgi:hypothetical protein
MSAPDAGREPEKAEARHRSYAQISAEEAAMGWGKKSIDFPPRTAVGFDLHDSGTLHRVASAVEAIRDMMRDAWPLVEAALVLEGDRQSALHAVLHSKIDLRIAELEAKHGPCPRAVRAYLFQLNVAANRYWIVRNAWVTGKNHDGRGRDVHGSSKSSDWFFWRWPVKPERQTKTYANYCKWIRSRVRTGAKKRGVTGDAHPRP